MTPPGNHCHYIAPGNHRNLIQSQLPRLALAARKNPGIPLVARKEPNPAQQHSHHLTGKPGSPVQDRQAFERLSFGASMTPTLRPRPSPTSAPAGISTPTTPPTSSSSPRPQQRHQQQQQH